MSNQIDKEWKVDYSNFIRPEIVEIIYNHAKNTTFEHFSEVWKTPNLSSLKGMILIFTGVLHQKYGLILTEKIILFKDEYDELCKKNPLLEFFYGEIETKFKNIVKRSVTDPHMIYLMTEGSPSSYMNLDSYLGTMIQDEINIMVKERVNVNENVNENVNVNVM